MIGGMVLGNPE